MKKKLLSLLLASCLVMALVPMTAFAEDSDMPDTQSEAALAQMSGEGENGIAVQSAGVAIDNTNFPDANFRTVVKKFDTNKDGSLSDTEIAAVEAIDCYNKAITNLKGIEYFTALKRLNCSRNQLTALDVSENTALTKLNCGFNKLTALDVRKNTALTELVCSFNKLTALDVSKNTALTYLYCRSNQLTALDISKNVALTYLDCSINELTSLDISNTDMSGLDCDGNIYQIVVDNDRTFDLSTLPGNFDVTKTSDWSGGTVNGNMLTVDSDKDTVTYKYDCGKGESVTFTLKWQYKDADYTKVNEAIAKANALDKDDYKDFTGVEAAVNAVVRGKNITEQSEVDAMAKAIEDAIADLQYKDADYTKVDAAIAKANALNKDDYKDFTGVETAVNAVVRGKNINEQSDVDAMAKAIEDAIAALQYKDADYTKVDEAITKANALNKDNYKDFTGVEAAVNAVVRDKNITEQSEVDAMAKAIEDAIAALQYKGADYTKVDEAIAKANALNKDDYKDFSGVEAAVNAVVRDKNITEQSEVDAMAKAIEDAIAALQYKDADYTKVDAAIAKANALNKDNYKDFSGVETAVNAVTRGKNITEQTEVDAMAKAIEDAIAALQYKDADYTKVDAAIAKANALKKDNYKDFSAVEAAVNAVVRDKNITEQSEVDAMAKAIEDAIAALQYKDADYTKVDAAIAKANALNKDNYKDFSGVETAVNAVTRGKNITEQTEVDAMAKAIEDAIAALQYKDADYTKVDAAIAKANALNKDNYKDFSGVETAVKAVVRDKNITEQSEVDAMAKAIEDAIAALQYKDADYTKVDAAIAKANALNKDNYKDFSGVETAVKAVVRGKNITEQSEVDKMAKAIEDAIAALEKKPASTQTGTSDKSPQTGDTSNLALWIALFFISGGAAIGTTVVSRKKKYNR